MDCPECGTRLVTYRLGEREAPVCEQCGHVGIDAEHRGSQQRVESWADALQRYYGETEFSGPLTVPVRSSRADERSRARRAETWSEALKRFYGGSAEAGGTDERDET